MHLEIENDFRQKIMFQVFKEPFSLESPEQVQEWRRHWFKELKSWHSPYKMWVCVENLRVSSDPSVKEELSQMVAFFEGFFLRKIVGYPFIEGNGHAFLPFECVASEEEAREKLGLRAAKGKVATDFRSLIQIENHFSQHAMELSFLDEAVVKGAAEIADLKSKVTNQLMQWHSKWNLVIDCSKFEVLPEADAHWERLIKVLKGLFLKGIVGYQPKQGVTYPFPVYRARHRAVAELESEGLFSGDAALCRSKKVVTD